MKNVLLIAPHPDDEIVGSYLVIKKILKQKKIVIFFLTNGVIDKQSLWFWERKNHKNKVKIRKKEMKDSMNFLGIKNFYIQDISTRSLKENIDKTFKEIVRIKKKNIKLIQFFVQLTKVTSGS